MNVDHSGNHYRRVLLLGLLTRFQPDYTAEDKRTGGIDNYLSCYNTDSDCTVHPSGHIHRYLGKHRITSTDLGQDISISVLLIPNAA